MRAAVPILVALLIAGCRAEPAPPLVTINDARVIALPTSAGAYFTLSNSGGRDRLMSVQSAVGQASLHQTSMEGGIMRMRALPEGIEVPAGATVTFSPSGTHVMVQGLAKPLPPGSALRLTLGFERQGVVKVDAPVGGPR